MNDNNDTNGGKDGDKDNSAPSIAQMQATITLLQESRLAEGEAAAGQLTREFPEHGFGWKLLGLFLKLQQQHGPALQAMAKAAQLLPQDDEAHSNLGIALAEANALPEAEAVLMHALQINPTNPRSLNNLGNLLDRQGRLQEAEACQRQALQYAPNDSDILCNLGSTLYDQGRNREAVTCYGHALQVNPHNAQAHWNASMEKLARGDFENGWKEYEWRWQTPTFAPLQRAFKQPLWLGDTDLHGKTILLHAEQGYGDTLQFCRYASDVATRGATVLLLVPPALERLLQSLPGVALVTSNAQALPPFDLHCPLMSLPLAFGTAIDSIPAALPYLTADAELTAAWQARLVPTTLPRIGIAWSGRLLHRHDYRRSIALEDFAQLFDAEAQFVSLQPEVRDGDREAMATQTRLVHFGAQLRDFTDTAALIASMDLVISVDTAVAHLAGAMGKPVWLLLPYQADWRWLRHRADSPWYPGIRLFRQVQGGDWTGPLVQVFDALRAYSKTP
jgi:Flp pilus assembly protein TadD